MNRLQALGYPKQVRLVFSVYSICFLAGTYTHSADIVRHGFLASPVPLAIGVYWNALTLLDPLAVLLLWRRPRAGIRLALAIMASDLGVNTYVYLAGYFKPPTPNMVPLSLLEQSLFGIFLFITAPVVYRYFQPASSQPAQ